MALALWIVGRAITLFTAVARILASAGIAWVVLGITWFLAPDSTDALFRYFQPVFLAELVAMLWLLIMGAKEQPLVASVPT